MDGMSFFLASSGTSSGVDMARATRRARSERREEGARRAGWARVDERGVRTTRGAV